MLIKPGVAFVSDIAAHHAEVLYGKGTPTLAALCDLAEICQAAVLNDTLAVAPAAYHGSTLLQQLDCVVNPMTRIEYSNAENNSDLQTQSPAEEILIGTDENGELTSDDPTGRLFLAYLAGEVLQRGPILGALADPHRLDRIQDRGLYFLDKFPAFMFLLQTTKGSATFESDKAGQKLLRSTRKDLITYARYAARMLSLLETNGVQPVLSCLEEPLGDRVRVNRAINAVQTPAFQQEFRAPRELAVNGNRRRFFECWNGPSLGLMVLNQAKHLDDLPTVIAKLRDTLLKSRQELINLHEAKHAALFADRGLDDRQYQEVLRIDQKIKTAFEAFGLPLAKTQRSNEIRRMEWVFNMPKYLSWLASLGIGSVTEIIEFANLKRRYFLSNIPGLYKTTAFLKSCDDRYIVDIVERLLRRPFNEFRVQALMLKFAARKVQTYSTFADGSAPLETEVLTIGPEGAKIEIPHSQLWARMLKEVALRQLLLHPLQSDPMLADQHPRHDHSFGRGGAGQAATFC